MRQAARHVVDIWATPGVPTLSCSSPFGRPGTARHLIRNRDIPDRQFANRPPIIADRGSARSDIELQCFGVDLSRTLTRRCGGYAANNSTTDAGWPLPNAAWDVNATPGHRHSQSQFAPPAAHVRCRARNSATHTLGPENSRSTHRLNWTQRSKNFTTLANPLNQADIRHFVIVQ
jgi:hypothetical protein